MISCDKAAELISAQLDGELAGEEEARLEAHLARCAPCRALQADFQKLHAALLEAASHWQAPPPEDLARRVLERVHAGKEGPPRAPKRGWGRRVWGAVAAALALAVIGGSGVGLWGGLGAAGGSSGAGAAPLALAPGGQGQEEVETAGLPGEGVFAMPSGTDFEKVAAGLDEPAPQADAAATGEYVGAGSSGEGSGLRSSAPEAAMLEPGYNGYAAMGGGTPEDGGLIRFNGALYYFPPGPAEGDALLEELPEGCASVGELAFIGEAELPAADLETNCASDSYGYPLDGREAFQDPSDPAALYVYEEQGREGAPAWRRCPLWEGN